MKERPDPFCRHSDAQMGHTPFTTAADVGNRSALDLLLKHGAYVHFTTAKGQTALMLAAWGGHTGLALHLIDKGAACDAVCKVCPLALPPPGACCCWVLTAASCLVRTSSSG